MVKSYIRNHPRTLQAYIILVLAVAQIASARLTDMLGLGQSVEIRSAADAHPLVPWGYAFAIWGVIYLWGLIAAIWQVLPAQRDCRLLRHVGWNIAGIYLINTVWQIWVPLRGIDWVSCMLIILSLIMGVTAMLRLHEIPHLNRYETGFIFAPLGLVTGWLSAAAMVNFTSILVGQHYTLNPVHVDVSTGFLVVLIVMAAGLVRLLHSLTYTVAVVWALFWIMMANLYRDHEPGMATVAVIGVALVIAVCGYTLRRDVRLRPGHLA